MKKKLLALAVAAISLSVMTKGFAYDFTTLDSQVLNGQVSQQEAQQTIDNAVKSGQITREELKKYTESKKEKFDNNCPKKPEDERCFSKHNYQNKFNGPKCHSPEEKKAFEKKLKDAGISKKDFEKAKSQGHEAVEALLKSHGIERPMFKHHGPSPEERKAFEEKLQKAGISKDDFFNAMKQGPDAVDALLKSHGIEAPKFKHHGPSPEERKAFEEKLQKAGISKDDFFNAMKQGPDAVDALLKSHGIERPKFGPHSSKGENCPPPPPPTAGCDCNPNNPNIK